MQASNTFPTIHLLRNTGPVPSRMSETEAAQPTVIKYIGSKRRLVPVLGDMLAASGASTALDLFTGTTRVAQEFKRRGAQVTAVDSPDTPRYSLSATSRPMPAQSIRTTSERRSEYSDQLPGKAGYFTETFCVQSRFSAVQRRAGRRHPEPPRDRVQGLGALPHPPHALIYAADRVDSTTGLQMAYVRVGPPVIPAPRARAPELYVARAGPFGRRDGGGRPRGVRPGLPGPSIQPASYYSGNYHVWETLVAWDAPEHYGVACKRIDSREPRPRVSSTGSERCRPPFGPSFAVQARVVILSYNDETWATPRSWSIGARCTEVQTLAFDSKRYVGAQIGIYNPRRKGGPSQSTQESGVCRRGRPRTLSGSQAHMSA